jgi:DNA-binding transcriptional LysR family regulator
MTFDGRDLRAFLAVVDNGSLGRAALVVNMAQPSLSRRIRELEVRLGGPLFERHSKGMALTAVGETLLEHARLLMFEMEQAENALAALNGLQRGTLRLGAVAAVCRDTVPRALAAMAQEFPDVSIELLEAPDSELAEALRARRVDLVIASGMLDDDEIEGVEDFPLVDRFMPCSRGGGGPADTDLDTLLERSWVMLGRGRTPRQTFETLVAATGRSLPRIAIETNSIGAQIALVANSEMLGWLPASSSYIPCRNSRWSVASVSIGVGVPFSPNRRSWFLGICATLWQPLRPVDTVVPQGSITCGAIETTRRII